MKRLLTLLLVFALLALAPAVSQAQNLLSNGGLNDQTIEGDPNIYYTVPTDWTTATDPCSNFPCAIVRYPLPITEYSDRTRDGHSPAPGTFGAVFNSTEGDFPGFPDVIFVDAHLTSDAVPATPGQKYTMVGWAYFEGGYAGGVDTIDPLSGTTRAGLPSLTDTFFALEFLDALGDPILGSTVEIELRADGQVNNPDITEATRNWMRHKVMGVAPANAVSVRVRASMIDGEFNVDLPHQAAWVDDFRLFAVPEPTTWLLGLLGLALAGAVRRMR